MLAALRVGETGFLSMKAALIGTKIGMTRVLVDQGKVEPVTVIKAGPCVVLQVKSKEKDGYDAVQIGYDDVKAHRDAYQQLAGCIDRGGLSAHAVKRALAEAESGPAFRATLAQQAVSVANG